MSRGRPRQFDPEKALDAALMLFWRHGYEGTSLAALADAMGINMPSLYGAFGNKESLFRKALARYIERPASYMSKALKTPDIRQAIKNMYQGAIDMVMEHDHPDGCLLVQGALASGPASEWVRHELTLRRGGAEAAVRRRLERAVEEGDLPTSTDPEQLARYLITVLWGMSVQAAGGATREQLFDISRQALRSLQVNHQRNTVLPR
ncbi:MAG: TetR/AcrR family transcriptional regulator [Phycisphaerales bacterium]|jgi:AcrR family transcriptional regulator|nr:TetR/AcrR family transcriptional regulator [Phycisphaerales bacterium]